MRWRQVDEVEGVLKFVQEKGDKPVTIPMHPKVRVAFKSRTRSSDPEAFVMPGLEALDTGTGALSKRFQEVMEEAKIEGKKTEALGAKGRSRASLSFHSLRHAFNTALANSGVSQETRMLLTGQDSKAVNDVYTHMGLETLRAAMERID
jgi:integrase